MEKIKVIIIGTREQLDKEQLYKGYGFYTGLKTYIRKPTTDDDTFYYIHSSNKEDEPFFTIDKRLVKFL